MLVSVSSRMWQDIGTRMPGLGRVIPSVFVSTIVLTIFTLVAAILVAPFWVGDGEAAANKGGEAEDS